MAAPVFISYRRNDAAGSAGRLVDLLRSKFPAVKIFFDTSTLKSGDEFKPEILQAIASADFVIAIIGPRWLGQRSLGSARIRSADDFVRIELRQAFEKNRVVLPVLVDGADLPAARELPSDIRRLAELHATSIPHASFHSAAEAFLASIKTRLDRSTLSTLILERTKRFVGSSVIYQVLIDDREAGWISNGQTLSFPVVEGMHKVQVIHHIQPDGVPADRRDTSVSRKTVSNLVAMTFAAGQTRRVICENTMMFSIRLAEAQ